MRVPVSPACTVAFIAILVSAGAARAQDGRGRLTEVPLPGGVHAALSALGDPLPPDRTRFLVDVIRRANNVTVAEKGPNAPPIQALLAQLDRAGRDPAAPVDMLPLPLPPSVWTTEILGAAAEPRGLVAAILRSREASRMYIGLLSLDDETRAWLVDQPGLLKEIASRSSAAFMLAAPGLRVAGGRIQVPGGPAAEPIWEALVGRTVKDPPEFLHTLLNTRNGRVANLFGIVSTLTPAQIAFVFALDATSPAERIDGGRRVNAVFESLWSAWDIDSWTSWRAPYDPVLLAADLEVGPDGRPRLPGTRAFWRAVFERKPASRTGADAAAALLKGPPADFPWLCERVFLDESLNRRAFSQSVLFASRRIAHLTAANVLDAVETMRAVAKYPALLAALERAGVDDVSTLASAARRAARLSALGNSAAAVHSISQFQGTLAIVLRAATRGGVPRTSLPQLVSSLSAIDTDSRGEYNGAVGRWIQANLPHDVFAMLAGPEPAEPHVVEWEGTRYQLDFAAAESKRLAKLFDDEQVDLEAARTDADLARALVEINYAIAIGQPDALPTSVAELAGRHDFALAVGLSAAWLFPLTGTSGSIGFHARGALLGLETALAPLSLVRVSSMPPVQPPSINDADRRVFVEAVTLVDPFALRDSDRDALVGALDRGRRRIAELRTAADASAVADEIRLSPARRTLLAWAVAHDRERLGAFLSLTELVWLGLGSTPMPPGFRAFGGAAEPRFGCLCVQLLDRRPLDAFDGRWNTGLLASTFSDLNLRITELLAQLDMPAALLGPVLAAATPDFVDRAVARDHDDRRGLLEYVLALGRDRVEEYLATLTADGPLVPVTGTGTRVFVLGAPR